MKVERLPAKQAFAKRVITQEELRMIKLALYLPAEASLPRCPAKDMDFVRECEKKGDYSHSARRHICEKCRCKRIAGWGTVGDFYGLGPHTGHLGCGWCRKCECAPIRRGKALAFALEHFRILQQIGQAMEQNAEFAVVVREEAGLAQAKREVREQIETVRACCKNFYNMLAGGKDESALVTELSLIRSQIEKLGTITEVERNRLVGVLDEILRARTTLTERAGNALIPMSDDTKMRHMRAWAETIAKLAVSEHIISKDNYVSLDDVKIRLGQTLNAVARFITDKEQWKKLMSELRVIWSSTLAKTS